MKMMFWLFSWSCLLFLNTGRAQEASPPAWFDLKSHFQLIQNQARKEGLAGPLSLQKFAVQKVSAGKRKLNLVTAQFGTGRGADAKASHNLSEIYDETTKAPKLLFQLVDRASCDSKIVESLNFKKLGFVNETQVHFAQVQLAQPTCANSVSSPKIFLIFQENKKGLEKIYQSGISENGRYRTSFQKDVIRLEYTKNLESESKVVELVWNTKTEKFEEQQP